MSPLNTLLQYTLNATALQISMDTPSPKTNVTSLPSTYQDTVDSCIALTEMDTSHSGIHSPGLLQKELYEGTHKF